jgi:hypothetical protein
MSIFGTKKKEKKEKKGAVTRTHHARATASAGGVAHEIICAPWFSEKALIVTERRLHFRRARARDESGDCRRRQGDLQG